MILPDDSTLLREWTGRRSEAAFRMLVERYAGMVHGTAMRRLGRSDWAAEAAQDAFVLLARKAPGLTGEALGAWLHRTAIFTASALLRKEVRHSNRVNRWARDHMEPHLEHDFSPASNGPELDTALDALPEADRILLVLRYFDNQSAAQAGARLGLSAEAAQKRTERALQRLGRLLKRRGVVATPAVLAAGLRSQLGQAAPAGFVAAAVPHIIAASAKVGVATIFLHTLATMKATHAIAITTLFALVPVSLLGLQNHRLKQRLESEDSVRSGSTVASGPQRTAAAPAASSKTAVTPTSPASAKPVAWDDPDATDKIAVELSRDTILKSDLAPLANYTQFTLSDGVRELLRISDSEAARVESALRTCEKGLRDIERGKIKRIEELPNGVVFEIPAFADEAKPLRDQLFDEVTAAVGANRAGFLLPKIAAATDWRLARFGAMKRRYRVEFQQDQPVIEADGSRRTTELLTTRIDYERGDSLSHSEIMDQDGPILAPVATKTKGTHVIFGEVGKQDAVMISPELSHLFTIEDLRK